MAAILTQLAPFTDAFLLQRVREPGPYAWASPALVVRTWLGKESSRRRQTPLVRKGQGLLSPGRLAPGRRSKKMCRAARPQRPTRLMGRPKWVGRPQASSRPLRPIKVRPVSTSCRRLGQDMRLASLGASSLRANPLLQAGNQ